MIIKIDETPIEIYPSNFKVDIMDLDNADSSVRTADGLLTRDVIATKRKLSCEWGIIEWSKLSTLLIAIAPKFFSVYYPDTMDGTYTTRTFYATDKSAPFAIEDSSGNIYWGGMSVNFIEQ